MHAVGVYVTIVGSTLIEILINMRIKCFYSSIVEEQSPKISYFSQTRPKTRCSFPRLSVRVIWATSRGKEDHM